MSKCIFKLINLHVFLLTTCTGATIPRKGKEAEPFQAKWTLAKEGQKKHGVWSQEAFDRFDSLQSALEEIRSDDEINGKAKQQYCLKIVRELNGIDSPNSDGSNGKKRAPTPIPAPIDPAQRKVKRRKE